MALGKRVSPDLSGSAMLRAIVNLASDSRHDLLLLLECGDRWCATKCSRRARNLKAAQREIEMELQTTTQGAVPSINQTTKIIAWLAVNGCVVGNLQKPTLQKA